MDTNVESLDKVTNMRPVKLGLLSAGFVTICVLFLVMFSFFQPDQLSLSDRYFPSPTVTHTRTQTPIPTLTPTRTPRPTSTSTLPPSLTPTAFLLLPPLEGVEVVEDTFESNTLVWDPYYSNNTLRIQDGKLFIQSNAVGFVGLAVCYDCLDAGQSFYFQAELLPEKDVSTEYGLAFCGNLRNNEYYTFFIHAKSSAYALYKHTSDKWEPLIVNASSTAIHKYPASNTLAVYFENSQMNLYINNNHIETYDDANPYDCRWSGVMVGDGKVVLSADNVYAYNLSPATVTPTP